MGVTLKLCQQMLSILWRCLGDKFLQVTQVAFDGKYFHKQKCQISLLNSVVPKFEILYYLEIAIRVCSKIAIYRTQKIHRSFQNLRQFLQQTCEYVFLILSGIVTGIRKNCMSKYWQHLSFSIS